MTSVDNTLLSLLRLALGTSAKDEAPVKDLSPAEWRELIDLAYNQGVAAIAADALGAAGELPNLDSPEAEEAKYDWLGSIFQYEDDYQRQWRAAVKMTDIFAAAGIKSSVLKGFSISRLYPEPSHRPCCDCDLFLSDYELGNQLMEREGVEVNRDFYKNSSFVYKGLAVENHQFCSPIRGGKRKKQYEAFLRSVIEDGSEMIDGSRMWSPGPLFNAIFLTSHAMIHFVTEGSISLRHLCDWAVVMKRYAGAPIWREYAERCREFGLWKFATSLCQVTSRALGVAIPFDCPVNQEADRRMLEDILHPATPPVTFGNAWKARVQLVKASFASSWKYKFYTDTTMVADLLRNTCSFFFERNPRL